MAPKIKSNTLESVNDGFELNPDDVSRRSRADVQPEARAAAKPPHELGVGNSSKSGGPGREP